jgi:hypothetical protein
MKKTIKIQLNNKVIEKVVKVRGTYAPTQKVVKSKKLYDRKKFKSIDY